MSDYFQSTGFQRDFNNLLKSLLLISKRIEDLTNVITEVKDSIQVDPNKEKSTEQFVTPPTTML